MIRTSERLKQGADLYFQRFLISVADEKRSFPTVSYPDKIDRFYFYRIDVLSSSEVEVILLQRSFYKKVEGYRQVNYQKYRILSSTLYKDKYVSIKLDVNTTSLNNLKYHSDRYISRNALGIISAIKNVTCYPTWAQSELLDLVHKNAVEKIDNGAKAKRSASDISIKNEESRKKLNICSIKHECKTQEKLKGMILKNISKSISSGFANHKLAKAIFTLGFYDLKRICKQSKAKAEKFQNRLDNSISRKETLMKESREIEDCLANLKHERAELEVEIKNSYIAEEQQQALDISNISQPFSEFFTEHKINKPASQLIKPNYEFSPDAFEVKKENLEGFVNLNDERISRLKGLDVIGVFAIRNSETGSFFTGISFDLWKSVSIMFVNFVPIDQNMLKEYKVSKAEDKSSIFTINIKIVKTENELFNDYIKFDEMFHGKFIHY